MNKGMFVALATVLITFVALAGARPARADHYQLRFEDAQHMTASMTNDSFGGQIVTVIGQPITADRTPGPTVLRVDGVTVAEWAAPPYVWQFHLGDDIVPYSGKQFCHYLNDGQVAQGVIPASLYATTALKLELFTQSLDDRGRIDDNRRSDASITLNFDQVQSQPQTGLSDDQVKAAIAQGYTQGVSDAQSAGNTVSQSAANVRHPASQPNLVEKTFNVSLDPGESMPESGQEMIIVTKSGQEVASVTVTGRFVGVGRYQATGNVPANIFSGRFSVVAADGR